MAIREKRNTGPEGLGQVKVSAKGVRISLEDGSVYEMPLSAVPAGTVSGTYRVSISRDKTQAYLHPVAGKYMFKFKEMGRKGSPVPTTSIQRGGPRQTKTGGTWVAPDEQVFRAVFEVASDGPYKGMTVSSNLPFSFAAPQTGDACDIYDSRRNLARIEKFLGVAGGVENMGMFEIPYNPDPSAILLWLEKYILKADNTFMADIGDKGFIEIDSFSSIPAELLGKKKGKK